MRENKRLYLLGEALTVFVGIPLLFYWELVPIHKIVALLIVAVFCGYQLWNDPDFGIQQLIRSTRHSVSKDLLLRLPLVAGGLAVLIALFHADQFFAFPAEHPVWWLTLLVLYPVLSALPQEFIYRTYFFHRYDSLFTVKYGTIIVSALAFAFLHVVYDNWWAVGLSFIGGLLFAITYTRTKSLFWVTVEHVLYGWLIFTLGFGNYFYESL